MSGVLEASRMRRPSPVASNSRLPNVIRYPRGSGPGDPVADRGGMALAWIAVKGTDRVKWVDHSASPYLARHCRCRDRSTNPWRRTECAVSRPLTVDARASTMRQTFILVPTVRSYVQQGALGALYYLAPECLHRGATSKAGEEEESPSP